MKNQRKDFNSGYAKNLKMNDKTYSFRKRVMKYVYEAKRLSGAKFRRIDVRITEEMPNNYLGLARYNKDIIWIPYTSFSELTEVELRHVVLHEIAHALLGERHSSMMLMKKFVPENTSVEIQTKNFKKLIEKYEN